MVYSIPDSLDRPMFEMELHFQHRRNEPEQKKKIPNEIKVLRIAKLHLIPPKRDILTAETVSRICPITT